MVQTAPPERESAVATEAPPQGGVAHRRAPATVSVGVVLVVLAVSLLARLGAQERGGPAHTDLSIGGGIPATLYLPQSQHGGQFPLQKPAGQRPPLVVVAHGYSADRQIMSPMARSLARAGYAVLTFDFRGHGSNTAPFQGDLRRDFDAVLSWAGTSPYVDARRIAVLGHSMGAGAALDFASVDPRPVAVVPMSGGSQVSDRRTPPHILFINAQHDPGFIRHRQSDLAAELRGRTAVSQVQISGKDHVTILYSAAAVREVVRFLDPVFGVSRHGAPPGLQDPRLGTAVLYLLVALALIGVLGLVVGRLLEPLPSTSSAGGLLLLIGALVVTLPLLVMGGPGFLPLGAGQPVITHAALAAAVLWAVRLYVRRGVITGRVAKWIGDGPWLPLRSAAGPGAAAALVTFLVLSPLEVVFHRLVPTWERLVLWVVMAALALPFFAAFEALVRRGGSWGAAAWGLLGRAILLLVLVVGVGLQVLPAIISLVLPILVLQYVILEVFADTCYATGRNPAVLAVVDAIFIAWMVTALTPVG